MATHQIHSDTSQFYFITFTCFKWMPLFEITDLYSHFENWFTYLAKKEALLNSYVIMPNHFHAIIFLSEKCDSNLNRLVGNGKRFLAYEIVSRLKKQNSKELLMELENGVSINELNKGKKHQVFIPSFDAKLCINRKMLESNIDYIHHNPVSGKWSLVNDWATYPHSSAEYYELGRTNPYITDYMELIL